MLTAPVSNMHLYVHTDGGSRGNPGHAAYGFVFLDELGQVVHENGAYLGVATNNEAEYHGLIASIEALKQFDNLAKVQGITFRLDSTLVVQQVQGNWKIKEPRLRAMVAKVRELLHELDLPYTLEYVPRAQNWMADAMVNQKLDAELG